VQKIKPFLWYDKDAEEAATLYVSIFKNSKVLNVSRYNEAGAQAAGRPAGSAMTVEFELEGQTFLALNGGPHFKFSEAVSFVVSCQTQEEIDYFWEKLTADGGAESQCGWLKDKFGLSWQIVPAVMAELMTSKEPGKAQRVMQAMLQMKKIEIENLKEA